MIGPRTFLEYRSYLYLKVAIVVLFASLVAYVLDEPAGGRSGSSWTGYALGTVAAGTIFWLMWLGVRKRDYRATGAPLKGWVSAHVYLGTALLFLVPLHSAFEFGMNVHTLAYVLMCVVIASGILGVAFYALVPTSMTRNRNNITLDAMLERIAEIDGECRLAAAGLPDYYARAVVTSIDQTRIGGSLRAQLSGVDADCGTSRALKSLRLSEIDLEGDGKAQERKLIELIARKELLLKQIRRDLRYKALLDLWLIVHVPFAFATCAALLVHVFVVFWYH
ncbi:MAG: hypothetical protein H6748_13115 [Spirochaetaceae bacterium]|nr:hypothetical protein [Spirochaetaceae bacterium]HPG24272.1 hypothetical protein [Myxococcota bacterium]